MLNSIVISNNENQVQTIRIDQTQTLITHDGHRNLLQYPVMHKVNQDQGPSDYGQGRGPKDLASYIVHSDAQIFYAKLVQFHL
jgi:hypothetical protein